MAGNTSKNTTAGAQAGRRHPKGLMVLFLTEMWERFGYYLMLGIFSLFMLDSWENGGMGFTGAQKSDIYGTYIGLVYLTPFIGGLLADRLLGYRLSIIIGGLLMSAGYFGLSLHTTTSFYVSLLLIIVGNGFFKPNISTLVGNLYNDDRFRANKDAGFNIFYMGINVGAFICNFVAAYMRINYGWGHAFAAAGVGMLAGLIIFVLGTKHVKDADVMKPTKPEDMALWKIFAIVLVPMFIFGIIGYYIKGVTGPDNPGGHLISSDTTDAFLFGCIPVISFFLYMLFTASAEDKRPIGALLSVYACIVIFWAVFHQNGDALTVWAEDYSDRAMPTWLAGPAKTAGMAQTTNYHESIYDNWDDARFTGLTTSLSARHDSIEKLAEAAPAGDAKKSLKEASKAAGDELKVREDSRKYFKNLPDASRPAKGGDLLLISTELFQSINPFWVVLLTPVIVGFFGFLRRRSKEPSTPTKIFIGLIITALSTLVMYAAVKSTDLITDKASSLWLVGAYAVITVGELCLSPMGLSLVSKLSPPRITALMMGGFFLSTAVGNKLAGTLSGLWEGFEDKGNFFLMNCGLTLIAATILFVMLKFLNSVMKEKNIH
jgi:proton-dependent oligopeptide transporter, POT family